jgi:hypothetical protein
MRRLSVLIPAAILAALSASPLLAQDAPAEGYKDLWCGLAFNAMMAGVTLDEAAITAARAAGDAATDEQKQLIEQGNLRDVFTTGAGALVERASAAYKTAGFTDEAIAAAKAELEPKVAEQINAPGENAAEFAFEECTAIFPGGDPMANIAG